MAYDDALQTNAADAEQLAHARDQVELEELAARARWRAVLGTKVLREWLWRDLLPLLRIYEHIVPGDEAAVGVRNVGLQVYGRINEHPDLYLQMRNEAIKREKDERATNRSSRVKRTTE